MVDKPSNAFLWIKDNEIEKNIFEKVYNKDFANLDERILNQGRVEKLLQPNHESTIYSSDKGQQQAQSSPTSNFKSQSNAEDKQCS